MNDYILRESTREETGLVDDGIVEYNLSKVPFTQEPSFIWINRVVVDENGYVVAGINSRMYCWNCLYIDVLWVKEEHRKSGFGSKLLHEVEKIAKEKGCHLIHLDTFDFQAKDFYIRNGYEIFGTLGECPQGHKRYFMKKAVL